MIPAIAPSGIAELKPADHSAVPAQVVELANRQITSFQKWTGRGLDECGRLGRLLLFRNLALAADLQCKWNRSDFFWLESHRQLRTLLRDPKVWMAAATLAGSDAIQPDVLKAAVVEELFVKTYHRLSRVAATFYPEKPPPDSREFAYARYLRDVFDSAEIDAQRQAELLVPLADRWIEAESQAKKWKAAIAIARDMIARVPQERKYPEQLMLLEYQSTRDGLTQGPLKPRDAEKLKAGIERIEQLRRQYTSIPLAFTLIGRLRHLRAIALGNNSELSEALIESQKGMDYAPGDEEAAKTHERLVENMKALRARMEGVLQRVRAGYNRRLTLQGQKLANEASKGFTAVNAYTNSAERTQIQQDVTATRSKSIWIEVGYAEPAADWDSRAGSLYAALTEVFGKAPSSLQELERLWRDQAAQDPLLAGLDPCPPVGFLARRLFPAESSGAGATTPQPAPEAGPEFEFESTRLARGDEPFLFWLFSRQGMRLKAQASLALLVLLCALSLAGFDSLRRSGQDHAYATLMAAANDRDFSRVIDASEDFLSHPALHHDARTPQVEGLYSEALVRWFSLIPGTPDQGALERVRRYQQLLGSGSVGGDR
jgi:hypothetical protein